MQKKNGRDAIGKHRLHKKSYFKFDPWMVREERFDASRNKESETVFCLGNGYMAMRGVFEEGWDGRTKDTTFIAGVFDSQPFNIRFMKGKSVFPNEKKDMKSHPRLFNLKPRIGGEAFGMAKSRFTDYCRTLDMRQGTLTRTLTWHSSGGRMTKICVERIFCLDHFRCAAVRYSVTPLNWSGAMSFDVLFGIDPAGQTSGWKPLECRHDGAMGASMLLETALSGLTVGSSMLLKLSAGGVRVQPRVRLNKNADCSTKTLTFNVREGFEYALEETVAVYTSRDTTKDLVTAKAAAELKSVSALTYADLAASHAAAWAEFWKDGDVLIEGDPACQQGIRFCLFHFRQAYRGDDPRLNISAKGLASGDQYFWDSEIYMLPSLLYRNPAAARSLMKYRYLTLEKARHCARRWEYPGAKYPWITFDGEDIPHPFWDCVVAEVHINAAVSYGVWHYVAVTDDEDFLVRYGAEILVETARFWAARACWNDNVRAYVINKVTGPDEYTPFVNNNCYTNTMAAWNLRYAAETVARMARKHPAQWRKLAKKIGFKKNEPAQWNAVADRMYIPFDRKLGIHLQDDAFLRLDHMPVSSIPDRLRCLEDKVPAEKFFRWDVLKQADVVLLMFLLGDRYSKKVKKANYDFYEPRTIHDSSLSPCMHAILAAEVGYAADAYEYFRVSVRLDLDDINNNSEQGIHTASTSGAWMAVAYGFAGLKFNRDGLSFDPRLPKKWSRCCFRIQFRGRVIEIDMRKKETCLSLISGPPLRTTVSGKPMTLKS